MIAAVIVAWATAVVTATYGLALLALRGPEAPAPGVQRARRYLRRYRYRGHRHASVPTALGGIHRATPRWGWV